MTSQNDFALRPARVAGASCSRSLYDAVSELDPLP